MIRHGQWVWFLLVVGILMILFYILWMVRIVHQGELPVNQIPTTNRNQTYCTCMAMMCGCRDPITSHFNAVTVVISRRSSGVLTPSFFFFPSWHKNNAHRQERFWWFCGRKPYKLSNILFWFLLDVMATNCSALQLNNIQIDLYVAQIRGLYCT